MKRRPLHPFTLICYCESGYFSRFSYRGNAFFPLFERPRQRTYILFTLYPRNRLHDGVRGTDTGRTRSNAFRNGGKRICRNRNRPTTARYCDVRASVTRGRRSPVSAAAAGLLFRAITTACFVFDYILAGRRAFCGGNARLALTRERERDLPHRRGTSIPVERTLSSVSRCWRNGHNKRDGRVRGGVH